MARLTKFSEAMSSSPSAWRRVSLSMAWAISGSVSASVRCIERSYLAEIAVVQGTQSWRTERRARASARAELTMAPGKPAEQRCDQRSDEKGDAEPRRSEPRPQHQNGSAGRQHCARNRCVRVRIDQPDGKRRE